MHQVLILGKIAQEAVDKLHEFGFDVVERPDNPADLLDVASTCDGIIVRTTKIDRTLLDRATQLKFVARHGVGYDAVDVPALSERGIPLAITGDVNSTAVAEHALALLLAIAKRTTTYDAAIRNGDFAIRDSFSAIELGDRTILIIGLGRIGRKVAGLAKAFGMRVMAADPFVSEADAKSVGVELVEDWRAALGNADVVSLHVPKVSDTEHLLGADEFAAMKAGGIVLNVSRGGLIDEGALISALDSGRLRAAGLDVFEQEPLPRNHPLALHPQVVLSPHSAAFTGECIRRMGISSADNVIAFAQGALDHRLVINRDVLAN